MSQQKNGYDLASKEFIERAKEPGEYPDRNLKGFILRVAAGESKPSFLMRGRIAGGSTVSITIGRYGDVVLRDDGRTVPLTARNAYDIAESIRGQLKAGIDPRDKQKQRKAEREAKAAQEKIEATKADLTLRRAFEDWKAQERKTKDSTKTLYAQVIGKHLHDWLDLPLIEITADMVAARYDKIADETIASANNCMRALRMLYNWLMVQQEDQPPEKQIIARNPVTALHRRNKWLELKPRQGFISAKQLPKWFKAVRSLENPVYADYFEFVILTGLRLKEASTLKWRDIDFENRVFTARDTKNGRDHTLPMTDHTETLLRRRESDSDTAYVFPAKSVNGYFRDARFWIDKVTERSGIDFTCHELRRTLANFAVDAGLSDRQRKLLLNHANRADVTELHYTIKDAQSLREPLEKVEALILKLAKAEPAPEPVPSKVVQLKKKAAARG